MVLKSYSGIILFCSVFICFLSTVKTFTTHPDFSSSETSQHEITASAKLPSRECYCGAYSSDCYFKNGNKVCDCFPGYAQTSNSSYGECQECDCGSEALSCHFDDNVKKCSCPKGYSSGSGKCLECDCGPNAISCEHLYHSTLKKCTCKEGYQQVIYYKNGLRDWCRKCECGPHAVSCKFKVGGMKECTCKPGSRVKQGGLLDGDEGCEECDCGENALSCSFNLYGDKKCSCRQGYVAASGICTKCDCGPHSTSCYLDYTNKKTCSCEYGYRSKEKYSWNSDEECVPNEKTLVGGKYSSWRIATYVMIGIFAVIVVVLLTNISQKKLEWC